MSPIQHLALAASLGALALAGCGGGVEEGGTGVLRLSLTDAPACGLETAFVTVEKVRVHKSATASDTEGEWQEVVLPTPHRIDLLTLTNGTLQPLGQARLPAGIYTQMRLVLAPNTPANPLANAVTPIGGAETALTTPSGQQSGLKLNVHIEVAADRIADFAIDFEACKSFVRAGNSGKILLKPVLSVIPILSDAGQRIEGYLDLSLAAPGTTVSAQSAGVPIRATPPLADGRFSLYPVPAGTYELVITAAGRVNAVVTGVPVVMTAVTTLGTPTARIDTPTSAASHAVGGTITANASVVDTGGAVRALQSFTGGPSVEVGSANALANDGRYTLTLPAGAPVRLPYAAAATSFPWMADAPRVGLYKLEATATGFATPKSADITLTAPVTQDFVFP
ncbi:MAG: DUF4382 domain-containing protein [Burkholderiales bacterium]|nr:DUF4382 domain-containing protein [Burkholderiales bacterium]